MAFSFLGLGSIIEGVGKIADDLFTSDEERLKLGLAEKQLELEAVKVEASLIKGQQEINVTEAKHQSVFVAGWRPFIGWVCGLGFAYQFLLYPVLMWLTFMLRAKGWLPSEIPSPPILDTGALMALATGMLGIGGMRSFDKLKKVASRTVKG